ncbi:MAG: hypothetical protein DCC75_05225 [Proteobacteria bacterium]|nr:MAG: hypothetical protein DCC75_05225 [Pseudomonadota bacterium]
MSLRNITLFSLVFILALSSPSLADFKLATVDINRVINESSQAKAKRDELEKKSSEMRKKIDERSKALKTREAKLKEQKVADESSEAEKFREDARDFSRYVKDSEEDMKKDFLKFNKTLTDKAVKVISDYAKKNEIALVLDKSEKGPSLVLFGDASFDISEDVIREMNR